MHSKYASQTNGFECNSIKNLLIWFQIPHCEKKKRKWSRSVVSDTLWPHRLLPAMPLLPWDFPGKNTGVGCHFLLQEIFQTQGSNPGLPHCGQMLYHLSHQGRIFKKLFLKKLPLVEIWCDTKEEYLWLSQNATKILLSFLTVYLCEVVFFIQNNVSQ